MRSRILISVVFVVVLLGVAEGYNVVQWKDTFVDPSRPKHKIPTWIFYPDDDKTAFPVIMFVHCYLGGDSWYDYLIDELVPSGYIMAIIGSEHYDVASDPKDLAEDSSYMLNYLRSKSGTRGFVTGDKAATMGHSEGGAAAFLSTKMNNFTSVATLSAGWLPTEIQSALEQDTLPSFLMSGTGDCLVPYTLTSMFYSWIPSKTPKFFVNIANATHCHFDHIGRILDEACHLVEDVDQCQKGKDIIPAERQFDLVKKYLHLWADHTLKGIPSAWTNLQAELEADSSDHSLTYETNCMS